MAGTGQTADEARSTTPRDRSSTCTTAARVAAWAGHHDRAWSAFIVGGIAVVIQNWPLFWVAVALLVVSLIATKVLQVMGHGAD